MKTDHIKEMYEDSFSKHGDSPAGVLWPKGRQDIRFRALTKCIDKKSEFTVLDYGCGLAHMKEYLNNYFLNVSYTGADMLKKFLDISKSKYPESNFYHVQMPDELDQSYDYVLSSGTFNILYTSDQKKNRDFIFKILEQLYRKTNIYLSVNFMTDNVDFKEEKTYHQNVTEIYDFFVENLSRRLILDQSYMPYEFTLTAWKDQNIARPEHVYDR